MKKKPEFSCTHGLLCIYYAPSFVTLVSFYLNFTTRVYAKQQTTTAVRVYSLHEFRYANFAQKLVIFPSFFQEMQAGKMCFIIFQNKKTPFQALKTTSSNSRKTDIFQNGITHGFGPKIAIFLTFYFLGNIGQENVFYDIQERKNGSLGCKNEIFKKTKIDIFQKGLTHRFGPKKAIFPTFFLGNIGKGNVFYDILERKNGF